MAGTPPVQQHATMLAAQPRIDKFLEGLSRYGTVKYGCEQAGVDRATVYRWRAKWKGFAKQWEAAIEIAADRLEEVAWKRAEDHSDGNIKFLLSGMRKEKYSDRREVVEERVTRATVTFTGVDWFDKDDEDAEPDTGTQVSDN